MPHEPQCRARNQEMTENQPKFTTHASPAMVTPTHVHNAKSAVNCDISKVNTHTHTNDGARYILVDSIKSLYRVFGLSKLTKEKTNKNGRKQLDMCPLRMHFNFKFDFKWRSMSLCGRGPWCASLHPRVDIKLRCGNTKTHIDTKWTKLKLLYDCLTMRRTHTNKHSHTHCAV